MTVGTLHVVVAGGGASGMSAASRIKRLLPKADVKVFERSSFVSYAPCGIPYLLGDVVDSLDKLVHYFVDFFSERAGYYPEPKAIKVKLVAEAESGKLLGAQIVGYEGVLARINTVAALLPRGRDG